jgi:hypothetical protein
MGEGDKFVALLLAVPAALGPHNDTHTGLAIQLSQGQGRQPLSPVETPPAARVTRA